MQIGTSLPVHYGSVNLPTEGKTLEAKPKVFRDGITTVATTGVDIDKVDLTPAENLTPGERQHGWAQIGASVAVASLNVGVGVAATLGLGLLGNHFFGTVGAAIGATVGLVGSLGAFAYGESWDRDLSFQPLKGAAAVAGANVGAAVSKPLQSLFPKAVKTYQLSDAALQNGVSEQEVKEFTEKLHPGDIILTLSNDDPLFHSIVSQEKKPLDFSHAALYAGDGQMIESNTDTGQVGYRSADSVLGNKAHIVAVRPNYEDGVAQKVVDSAASYLGRPYDWYLNMDDKRFGCVELPYHALKNASPSHQVPISKVRGLKNYIFPSDFMLTSDSKVVASAGTARPASTMRLARYAWAASEIGAKR